MQPTQSKSPKNQLISVPIFQHLYQIYPSMPKYAADPSESPVIETYDHILNRFQGHYGYQPQFFIRSPAYLNIFGDKHSYVEQFSRIGLCSTQEIIIAIKRANGEKIRVNNYQKAIYGQQNYGTSPLDWKFDRQASSKKTNQNEVQTPKVQSSKVIEEYSNIFVSTLKHSLGNDKNYRPTAFDILIYCDFLPQEHLEWRISLICALHAAFQIAMYGKKSKQANLSFQAFKNVIIKVQSTFGDWRHGSQLLFGKFGEMLFEQSNSHSQKSLLVEKQQQKSPLLLVKFPQQLAIVVANSMTPLPKKLVQGKRWNLRQCQILIGIELIKAELGIVASISSINQLMQNMSCTISQLLDSIQQVLPHQQISVQQLETLTEKTLIQILKEVPFANNVIDQNLYFEPYKRMKFFVLEEILLKDLQEKLLNKELNEKNQQQILIDALNQSAKNARELLNEPSEQILNMVSKVQGLFYIYKILGNGWGGNIAFFCSQNNAEKIIDVLNKEFYLSEENKILLGDELQMYTSIVRRPANGIAILDPQSEIWY